MNFYALKMHGVKQVMNRQEKSAVVDQLRNDFEGSQAIFVVAYKGLTVSLMQSLRKELRKHEGSFKVAKGRLMKRATEGLTNLEPLHPYFKNQIGLIFAEKNSPTVAKVIVDFAKDNAALQVLVGCFEERFFDSTTVKRLAALPSREILLAQLCGALKSPMVKLAITIKQISEQCTQGAHPAGESVQE